MRIEMAGWSVRIPEGWTAVVGDDHSWLRLFLAAEVRNDEAGTTIHNTATQLGFHIIPPTGDANLEDHADAIMARALGQGRPEILERTVSGVEARAYGWSDGVSEIETLFVEIHGGTTLLRIDMVSALASRGGEAAAQGRREAVRVLDGLNWR